MKKWHWLTIVGMVLVIGLISAVPALAATLNPAHIGSSCAPGETGTWHFVNNQTGGAGAGVLTATFGDAGTITTGPSAVNANTQHFNIVGPAGPLLSASTDLPGRLVLSDLTCTGGEKPTPTPTPEKKP